MTRGAIILNIGGKHCVHAAVAVASLREHYDRDIALITETAGPGRDACELIASDPRLAPIRVVTDERLKPGSHGKSYFCKTLLPELSPFDTTLMLDADTLTVGSLDEVWPKAEDEIVLTQFCDWVSTGGRMRNRIKPWAEPTHADGQLIYQPDKANIERVRAQLRLPRPAINTGVMAWSKGSKAFCDEWHRVAAMRNTFIVDETACQIIFPDFNCRVLDDRFNCSVVYPPAGTTVLGREDIRLWHGHGQKFWKNDGSGKQRPGQKIFLPHYERFLQQNSGGICKLRPSEKNFAALSADDQKRIRGYWI